VCFVLFEGMENGWKFLTYDLAEKFYFIWKLKMDFAMLEIKFPASLEH
jgi:hypothetical protein